VLGRCQFSDPVTQELNRQYGKCLVELRERLRRYRFRIVVFDSHYEWLQRSFVMEAKDRVFMWETGAVSWLTQLLERPEGFSLTPSPLIHFHKCRNCDRWFFAVTDHQRYCQESCRQQFASQSPEFREKRRLYMRERYRPLQKEMQARSSPAKKTTRGRAGRRGKNVNI
jgi:hypothetical protein